MKFDNESSNTKEIPKVNFDDVKTADAPASSFKDAFSDVSFAPKKSEPVQPVDEQPAIVPEEPPARASNAAQDDFVIGQGFEISQRDENIRLGKAEKKVKYQRKISPKEEKKVAKKAKKEKKKHGCLGAFIWIFLILGVSVGLAVTAILAVSDVFGMTKNGTSQVDIPEGSSTTDIAEALKEADAIRFPLLFRLYSRFKHNDGTYLYGFYDIQNEGGYDGIMKQLQTQGAVAETTTLRIPEGAGIVKISKLLEKEGICTAADFMTVANDKSKNFDYDFVTAIPTDSVVYRLEGYLFPDTYEFFVTDNSMQGADLAIRTMLAKTNEIWNAANKAKIAELSTQIKYDMNIHKVMTMASIIELETSGASEENMKKVAAVFYNRLNWNDRKILGSSPTAQYAINNNNPRYDTNKSDGLPPGPYCASSMNSILAALNPEKDFDYNYFVTDMEGQFYFNETLGQHNSTIGTLESSGNWNTNEEEAIKKMFEDEEDEPADGGETKTKTDE